MLKGKLVYLRMVEPDDATKLMLWENNPEHWKVTDTEVPFSLHGIMQLIEQQQHIRSTGQLRFMICTQEEDLPVGAIDLYDADFRNAHAAVGVLIGEQSARGKGYASESISLLTEYATHVLALNNLTCSIQADNIESISLFERAGFNFVGTRKGWFNYKGKRIDELIYQLCLEK